MVAHTRSVHVGSAGDEVYLKLVDTLRLPDYFPPVRAVRGLPDGAVEVAVGDGVDALRAEVELDRDGPARRLVWRVRGTPCVGMVVVRSGPSEVDTIVTVTVEDGAEPADLHAELEQDHDPGHFGGAHGREALPVNVLTAGGASENGARLGVGDVLERALDRFRAYVESGSRH